MAIEEKQITIDAFFELAHSMPGKRLELIDGRPIVMSPSSRRNTRIAAEIITLLNIYAKEHDAGEVASSDGGYILAEATVRAPDVGFVLTANLPEEDDGFYTVPPDLAVEVISPSETRSSVRTKTLEYLNAGTHTVWNVYPDDETVDVMTLNEEGKLHALTLTKNDTITCDILPAFSTPVGAFFA